MPLQPRQPDDDAEHDERAEFGKARQPIRVEQDRPAGAAGRFAVVPRRP